MMHDLGAAFRIGFRGMRKWRGNFRIIFLFLYMLLNVSRAMIPILRFSDAVGIGVAPWIFPFLSSDMFLQVVLMLGAVLLFCDAPFFDESAPYVIGRSGRYVWSGGQVLYIFGASAVYVLAIVLFTICLSLFHMDFTSDWGKVIGTLTLTGAGEEYGTIFSMSSKILRSYTPAEAMLYSVLLTWMATAFVGLVMYLLNSFLHHSAGTVFCGGLVMMNYFIYNFLSTEDYQYSPFSLSNLGLLNDAMQTSFLTVDYAIRFYVISLLLLAGCSIFSMRRRTIETSMSF